MGVTVFVARRRGVCFTAVAGHGAAEARVRASRTPRAPPACASPFSWVIYILVGLEGEGEE